ncbi:MAG TPA: hypothetical protein VK012_05750, partial [Gemmatimonadales bacterium]|nr:hypothetical protein [Gemmatimonadales bacterium]
MPARRCLLLLMGLGLPIPELAAQDTTGGGTKDQARLVFNVNAGYAAGVRGWRVTGQPLIDDAVLDPILIDTLTLARRIRPALTFGVKAIYFAGDHLGVHGEAQLLGLGFEDSCARTTATASARNAAVCSSINNADHSGSAVLVGGGLIYRINSRGTISPFARVGLGTVISTQSSVLTIGRFPNADGELVDVEVYPDESTTQLSGAGTLGLGFTAVIAPGYQLRWEVTDRIVGVRGISGPTMQDRTPARTSVSYRHVFGIEV